MEKQEVSIRDAAHFWNKNQMSVRRAIDSGNPPLDARQDDRGHWLISVESLRARWGDPLWELVAAGL